LTKPLGRQKQALPRGGRRARPADPPGDGGPGEAAAYIAETTAELGRLALRHNLDLLGHLLAMAQMEAEERTRSRRKLS
jgi:hypothetical protein